MPIEKEMVGKVIGQSSGVLEKAYDDLAHPTAKSVGNTFSPLPRTIGVWLGRWEKWIINGEESIRLTAQAVEEKAAQIPEEKLTEPEPYVAVPAIQQLSYCYNSDELRSMYANLLVASMNSDTKWQVHPSFVDIIKQITPDEAKLLSFLCNEPQVPTVDVKIRSTKADRSFRVEGTNCILVPTDLLECIENVTMYLDNLMRLKLIEIPYDRIYKNDSVYSGIERECRARISIRENEIIEFERKTIEVTSFGKQFAKTCLS